MAARVLFVCTRNSIRSPMAEALAKDLATQGLIRSESFESAGVDPSDVDGFAISVMAELEIDLLRHDSQDLEDVMAKDLDLVITLSDVAAVHAQDLADKSGATLEAWSVEDPSRVEGSREEKLAAYRQTRQALRDKLLQRFAL